jgi:uncharacterized membrane protein (UPF0136 family)
MSRRQELAARRAMLVARCETQRWELAIGADDLAQSLRTVDAAVGVARRVASHPLLVAGAVVAAVVIFRPRRLLQGLTWGLSAAVAARRASALFSTGA